MDDQDARIEDTGFNKYNSKSKNILSLINLYTENNRFAFLVTL